MKTFEEYITTSGVIYQRKDEEFIDSDTEWNLAALLGSIEGVDYKDVWITTEYESYSVGVYNRKLENDEEFEQRKVKMYNEYVKGEGARQQREIEEYKRLKLKYEGVPK